MVTVAQLAEHWIVVPRVVGSSPIGHPKKKEFSNELLFCLPHPKARTHEVPPFKGVRGL